MKKISDLFRKLVFGEIKRLRLRDWARLEDYHTQMKEYTERGGWLPVSEIIVKILNLCGVKGNFKKKPWYYTAALFDEAQRVNQPRLRIPMLETKEKEENVPWNYFGREWVWWLDLFAKNYGWNEEEISNLDIDDALGLCQEIVVRDQMKKEWEYGLSELAYEYIPSSKKSKFRPLPRPDWMLPKKDFKKSPDKKVKILRSMLPKGKIVSLEEENEAT